MPFHGKQGRSSGYRKSASAISPQRLLEYRQIQGMAIPGFPFLAIPRCLWIKQVVDHDDGQVKQRVIIKALHIGFPSIGGLHLPYGVL